MQKLHALLATLMVFSLALTPACGDDSEEDDNGGSSTNAGTTSTNGGTTSTNGGTTSTNGGTTSTNGGTTSTNGGTTSTNAGTTSTNSGTTTPTEPTIVGYLTDATTGANFTTLTAAVVAAELDDVLAGDGPFTVFAPTDAAFAALLEETGLTAEELLAAPELATVLTYHVVAGEVPAADVVTLDAQAVPTVAELPVYVNVTSGGVFINGVQVSTTDVEVSNGVIHVIDGVLIPPEGDIVDTAASADMDEDGVEFSVLLGAATDAGLVDTLRSAGPFTIFAPTDMAFSMLETVPEGQALVEVLTFHAVAGAYFSPAVLDNASLTTVNGAEAMIDAANAEIEGAELIAVDVVTTNGVIHVIDAVMIP